MVKAILIHSGVEFGDTHNMSKLTKLLVEAGLITIEDSFVESAMVLNQFFCMASNPDKDLKEAPYKVFSQAQAESAIDYALSYYDLAMHIFGEAINPILLDKRNEIQQTWESIRPEIDGMSRK